MTSDKLLDKIIFDIHNGVYSHGKLLPSELTLAEQYGFTRYEIRKMYEKLEDMGYVTSKKGVGRYVRNKNNRFFIPQDGLSFSERVSMQGKKLETLNVGFREIKSRAQDTKEAHRWR